MSTTSRPDGSRHRALAFEHLLDEVHEGVFVGLLPFPKDDALVTLAANRHLKSLLGYAADVPESEVAPFAAPRFDDPQARTSFLDRLLSEGALSDYLLRMRRVDGTLAWVAVTAHAVVEGDGSPVRLEALLRDAGERRRLDDRARDLYQQLLQSDKMAALGQTISGVAHELNNPLATILSWAERIAEQSLDSTTKRGVEVILSEAERAARIVKNLLTFARKRPSTRALIDMNVVVRETLALRPYAEPGARVTLVTALASGLPAILADAHQVQQVLLNLVINAEQAMLAAHGHGSIVVRTWFDSTKTSVVLEVNDDGPGLAAEIQGKVFDPFFTTKEIGKGTGLGLTVAYAIVQEHGGRIRVESALGRGASFVVELPVQPPEEVQAAPTSAQIPVGTACGASILLVEDEHALAQAVADALTHAGLHVEHASDGEEAMARVRQRTYDVVICDLKMPRVNGMMLYRAIAAETPALARRVVFVTGDVADTDAERFLLESGCRWLVKPFRTGDLLRAVSETLG